MPRKKSVKISIVPVEQMEKDLSGGKKSGRHNPLYDQIIESLDKVKDQQTLSVDLSVKERTGLVNKMKKMELLATRKDPSRPFSAKFKILDRDAKSKPSRVRVYILRNPAA